MAHSYSASSRRPLLAAFGAAECDADSSLLEAFAESYGLLGDAAAAAHAGVARFPLELARLLPRACALTRRGSLGG